MHVCYTYKVRNIKRSDEKEVFFPIRYILTEIQCN